MINSEKEMIQALQYNFPYHYVPKFHDNNFSQTYNFYWGYQYLSIMDDIKAKIKNFKIKKHLDFGCGDGRFLAYLYDEFSDIQAVGLDLDCRAISYANLINQELTKLGRVSYELQDILNYPSNAKFDLITSIEVFEHIPPNFLDNIIQNIYSKLSSDGILIFSVPSTNLPVSKKHYQHFSREKILNLFKYFYSINIEPVCVTGFKNNFFSKILTNRFFLLNYQPLLNFLFRYYRKNLFHTTDDCCEHFIVTCRKNEG